jgi:putative ABC transport system permease protein
MEDLTHDLRGAVRYLRSNLSFSAATILILALGIAAATAIFSASEALLIRPLPYPDSERLVTLRSTRSGHLYERVSAGTLADWQLQASSFEAITGYRWYTIDVLGGTESQRLHGLFATPEFFRVFTVPLVGREFLASDRGIRTIVLGHDVWRRRFEADPTLVGKTLTLNARNFTRVGPTPHVVLGIATAPVRFPPLTADFQLGLGTVMDTIDFWAPEFVSSSSTRQNPELDVVAKLRPGVTIAQAQGEMDVIAAEQAAKYPDSQGRRVRVVPLREEMVGAPRTGLVLLAVGTWMLLLIACADVATLVLARGGARRREVAIRAALGAPRWRIVRQFLLEAMILATFAGTVGVVISFLAIELARPWLPASLPLLEGMTINTTVAGFAVICAILTACLTAIAPALVATRDEAEGLAGREGSGLTPTRHRTRLVRTLISVEVALVVILLLGAGLLVRSAWHVWQVDPGFDSDNLLTLTVSLPENKFEWNHNAVFVREVIESVGSLPSVTGATVIQGLPMRAGSFYGSGDIEGFSPRSDADKPVWRLRVIGPGYFDVMRIPIVQGRGFEARDEEGEVGYTSNVIVSSGFANRYWPGENPLGRRIGSPQRWETIVGVAADVHYAGLERDPTDDVYYPQALFPQAAITLIARTRGDPLDAVSEVRARIRAVDQDAFLTDVRSMDQVMEGSQAERRAGTFLVTAFGAIALMLVLAGVYSVVAQAVVQRQLELAIRAALGAGRWRIVALAMRTALLPAVIGITVGILGGLAVTRLMTSVLFGVHPADLMTWVGACTLVLIASLAAGYPPARRAAHVDPMTALKAE